MKNLKALFIQSMLVAAFGFSMVACNESEVIEPAQEEASASVDSKESTTERSADLRHLLNGPNFRRFYYDANGDGHTDLVGIKTRNTGTRSTEIHVLDGKSRFSKFIIQTGTALHETGSNWVFLLAPTRRGGRFGLQVYGIKKSHTGTRTTEVHVLSQNFHNFKRFVHQSGTVLPETDNTYSFQIQSGPARNHLHNIKVFRRGQLIATLTGYNGYK